jgi:hypothetical protein
LVVAPEVAGAFDEITVSSEGGLERPEAMKLLEKALSDQAGIAIARLDEKRATVSYNPALKTNIPPGGR